MTDNEKSVDTTVDPAKHSKGVDADLDQTGDERDEAIDEFDGHLDGSGIADLPQPGPGGWLEHWLALASEPAIRRAAHSAMAAIVGLATGKTGYPQPGWLGIGQRCG